MPGIAQFLLVMAVVIGAAIPLSRYLQLVLDREPTLLDPVLGPVERLTYRVVGVDPAGEMTWLGYAISLLAFSAVSVVTVFILLLAQGALPLNPNGAASMSPILAFNVAVAFATNTNWQVYAGETGVSHLIQMIGLTWQNFMSAAVGVAVAAALVRGLTRTGTRTIGNFWVDLTRTCLFVLLPLCLVLAIMFVGQGVAQNLSAPIRATGPDGAAQTIPQGPVASQEAIKQLGTNGGGFFNANSAHPYENPTPLTNALQVIAILLLPAALALMVGRFAGDMRQGWVLLGAMVLLFVIGLGAIWGLERGGNPLLMGAGAAQTTSEGVPSGNMEGKEVRFGVAGSALFVNATTAASCGAVNTSHDSLMPLSGGVAMLNIALGEVIFGGVGSGLYGMLIFAMIAVFIAGLMVGRTPEYLGKKLGPKDMKLAMFALLALEAGILITAGAAVVTPAAAAATLNAGPHALSEILYGVTSAVGNNGSAMGGLAAAEPFYAVALSIAMLIGRYLFIVPVLGIAGSMATKKVSPASTGTFPTNGLLFVGLLVGVIIIVGALTFFPAYALGPVLEQLLVGTGRTF
ncbi:MAG: potassium-transporting ATPase subunit KdpA [Coriobacteriia bacterium]|nr:potassium-transporting ATPase subunit KdpA [Coriobacteriia bacterium]